MAFSGGRKRRSRHHSRKSPVMGALVRDTRKVVQIPLQLAQGATREVFGKGASKTLGRAVNTPFRLLNVRSNGKKFRLRGAGTRKGMRRKTARRAYEKSRKRRSRRSRR